MHWTASALLLDPTRTDLHKIGNKTRDTFDLFRRSVLIAFVMDRNEPEARLTQPRVPFNPLVFKTLARVESPLVEHLRSRVAKLWVQSPRLFQEQARIGRNRLLPGEQVFKGRNLGTIGMTALVA